MQALIEIDLPEKILQEWEPVAVRKGRDGDPVLTGACSDDAHVKEYIKRGFDDICLVFRPRFKWPGLITCRYLTWDASGNAFGWFVMPEMSDHGWVTTCDGGCDRGYALWSQCIDLPFPGGDWRTRIEENPNWGK